ncbi:hypothetical protein [Streptomyces sp. NPDC000410]|uniref:hypothetical protein n=1 Tax=Streptomyces sp. NPDC000410 TaxID=3154254 RepID=UPI003319DDF6
MAGAANRTAERVSRWPTPTGHPGSRVRPDKEPERLHPGYAFKWDFDDFRDKRWRPQGITQDYDGDGRSPAKTLLVSWYARPGARRQGARLTVVNWSASGAITYRHALLVEPFSERDEQGEVRDDFGATDIHAGGIARYGNDLYIADSGKRGIRVFDLQKFFKVARGSGIGRQPDGKTFHAFGYEYVLPQSFGYDWVGSAPTLTVSQVSVDRTTESGPGLLVSEFDRDGRPRLVRWPFEDGKLRPQAEWAAAVPGGTSTQGAVKVRSTYYLTTSRGSTTRGELRRWKESWVDGPKRRSGLNIGCEDLSYDGSGAGALWTLGEYANDVRPDNPGPDDPRAPFSRYVYAVKL